MMTKIYFLIFLICVPLVVGVELHDATYTIEKNIVTVKHLLTTSDELSIILLVPADAYNFDITVDGKLSEFTLERTEEYKRISIPLAAGSHKVGIKYVSAALLEKGKYEYFVAQIITTHQTKQLITRLILPEGALLARPITALNPPVSPKPAQVETTGRQITIVWKSEDLNTEDNIPFFVVYETKGFLWVYSIIVIFIVVLIGVVLFFYMQRKRPISKKEGPFAHLLESEKRIVSVLLKAKENTMWQKELQIAVGFTKSKLSRTVRNMEQRGLLKKIPYGTTNKIQLVIKGKKENAEKKESETKEKT